MNKFICIHGHFYQPPRENPWLEEVELQESARPYHDWNERISAECYARNGASRIMNSEGYIVEVVNNYSKISFNIGPTLLSWMEKMDPDAYRSVLEADRLSRERFSGHGSAIAQVYNHMIMPLANTHDKRTQIIWGIKDFESRFQRMPEGMWLAEAAVDLESLDIMAEQGIKFTVLAPHQAKRAKKIGVKRAWLPEDEEAVDLRRPYLCRLPSGRTIALFFYDGPVSQSVAFEGLLHSGEALANRILGAFDRKSGKNQMVHIATDGESYGHHHKFGDMALAYCLHHIEKNGLAHLTVYGEYLEKNPPEYEVEIVEKSSWSCIHGIERWRDNCGCNSGGKPGWRQEWRAPLRQGLDWLRDNAAGVYARELSPYVSDPWALRDKYIAVILKRTRENMERFLAENVRSGLSFEEKNKILRLLELQRNAQLMYTSCGWFFDDISGIETVQILKYAARVIQLVQRTTGEELELGFIEFLGRAKSNVPEANNGARIYKTYVDPSIVNILRVGAHYAMSSLFLDYSEEAKLYCFTVRRQDYEIREADGVKLVIGRAEIISEITWTTFRVQFVVLYLGDHQFITSVGYAKDDGAFAQMRDDLLAAMGKEEVPVLIQIMNRFFGGKNYSLWHLFRHEQKVILDKIFEGTMADVERSFRELYEKHLSLIEMINENGMPLPKTLVGVIEFVLNRELVRFLEMDDVPVEPLRRIVAEIQRWPFKRDKENLDFLAGHRITCFMQRFARDPENTELLQHIVQVLGLLQGLGLDIDIWKAQNLYYAVAQATGRAKRAQAEHEECARNWIAAFNALGVLLKVRVL